MPIYHITTRTAWEEANRAGGYQADSLAAQGFIHFSTREQVLATAQRFYRGQAGLVLLRVESERLEARVVYENLEGGTALFPHLYGPLNLDAVSGAASFPPRADGSFDFPAEYAG
jgi:uncharacterized protein (DUF952 family)